MQTSRSTKQRRAILGVFKQQSCHLAAEDVYEQVRTELPRISLGTVYRNLETLTQQGYLQKTVFPDGKARYEGVCSDHHHHMICMNCSAVSDIELCPLRPEIQDLLQTRDFDAVYHRFEVFGYCKDCRDKVTELSDTDEHSGENN